MNSRILFLITIGLIFLLLGIVILTFITPDLGPIQVFPATIQRECAPWDGAAFTLSIPMDKEEIAIAIWQSPNVERYVSFSFPDNTGHVGNASLRLQNETFEQLGGKVTFQRVQEDQPVEGGFDLTSERGERFSGRFVANWEDFAALCG